MKVAGVDGTKKGWLTVILDDNRFTSAHLHATFADVLAAHPDASVIGVDMPIGLVESGLRKPDQAARNAIGRLRSSVFVTPPRVVIKETEWPEALAAARVHMGLGISKQAFALFPRIREVDTHVEDTRLVEVHPEVSFACLAGAPLTHGKKTWTGATQRRALLASVGIELPADLGVAGKAPVDDVLDAAVAAWSANRVANKRAVSLPAEPGQRDRCGRVLAIWS